MTPAEHIDTAEKLAEKALYLQSDWTEDERIAVSLIALTHATIALAIEQGAPHQSAAPTGASSG